MFWFLFTPNVGHGNPAPRPLTKQFLVLDHLWVDATLEPVFLAERRFFCCQNVKNCFQIRPRLQTVPQTALVGKGYLWPCSHGSVGTTRLVEGEGYEADHMQPLTVLHTVIKYLLVRKGRQRVFFIHQGITNHMTTSFDPGTRNSSTQRHGSKQKSTRYWMEKTCCVTVMNRFIYRLLGVWCALYPPTTALAVPSWKDQARERASTKCSCFSRQSIRWTHR